MSDARPENFILGRMDRKLDALGTDMQDIKGRMAALEVQMGFVITGIGRCNERIDAVEVRLDRIERRLDLIDEPTAE